MGNEWSLIRVIPHRTDAGKVWRLTQVWENSRTFEQREVYLFGLDLNYVEEVA